MNSAKNILKIDLSKIVDNYHTLSTIVANKNIGAAVKANAYGLGAVEITKALSKNGCKNFFVASIDEAINLKQNVTAEINIFVLNGVFTDDVTIFDHYGIIPVLNNLYQIEIWQQYAIKKGCRLPAILHFNTGIHRLGISHVEIVKLIQKPELIYNIDILYIMSHLSAADDKDNSYNSEQLLKFSNYTKYFPNIKRSFANSSGVFLGEEYHFDLIRSGAAIYGINPTPYQQNPMQNVVSLDSPVIHLQTVPKNSKIGYNCSVCTDRETIIATLPIGYADGYPRSLSNRGTVYISGFAAPVIGIISMDLTLIDVTDIPSSEIFLGKEVEIIGDNYPINQLATDANTIGYEVITRIGTRYSKIYKKQS